MRYLLLLVPLAASAAEPTYQFNGAYPGMPAAIAKSAGFNVCTQTDHDTIVCRPKQKPSDFYGVPVTDFFVSFSQPYEKINQVVIKTGVLRKKTRDCQPTKGQWGDLIPNGCATDAGDVLATKYGPAISYSRVTGSSWHRCDLDTVEFKDGVVTIVRAPDTYKSLRSNECDALNARQDASAKSQRDRESFIKGMK